MTIASPLNEIEMRNLMYTAQLKPARSVCDPLSPGKGGDSGLETALQGNRNWKRTTAEGWN